MTNIKKFKLPTSESTILSKGPTLISEAPTGKMIKEDPTIPIKYFSSYSGLSSQRRKNSHRRKTNRSRWP